MKLAPAQLERMAAETGFQTEPLEKVLHLLELLEALLSHPFLADRLVLKGGAVRPSTCSFSTLLACRWTST